MSSDNVPESSPPMFESIVNHLLGAIEGFVDSLGWDRPASLWRIDMVDSGEALRLLHGEGAQLTAQGDAEEFSIALGLDLVCELEGDPVEALVGVNVDGEHRVGAIFVTEGFINDPATDGPATDGPATDDPATGDPLTGDGKKAHQSLQRSRQPDGQHGGASPLDQQAEPDGGQRRREVRIAHLVLTDGTEAVIKRERDDDLSMVQLSGPDLVMSGPAVWFLRRTLGMRSRAGEQRPQLATTGLLRARVKAAVCAGLLLVAHSSSDEEISEMIETSGATIASACDRLGLGEETWEQARARAFHETQRAAELATGRSSRDDVELLTFLSWCDGDLWADRLDRNVPTLEDSMETVEFMFSDGSLPASLKTWLHQMLHME